MIQIKTASLKAAVLIAPPKELRKYLIGVQILVKKGGAVHVRASDGACAFDDLMPEPSLLDGADIIIPLDVAKALAKEKAPLLDLTLRDDGKWECAGRIFAPVEGRYPDMDRVIPAEPSGAERILQEYNYEQVARCQKALQVAREAPHEVYRLRAYNPGSAALMRPEDAEFPRCVVMPLRTRSSPAAS